jgi:hypothetical protein
MLQCVKNKKLLLAVLSSAVLGSAQAGILIEYGAGVAPVMTNRVVMSSIILAPNLGAQSESSYSLQRSLAWRMAQQGNDAAGAMLVVPPALGGVGSPSSIRQLSLRNNMARANAYRLNYFKR